MDLRHLKIFVTVYESKTLTEASENLFIAQPSVSLAIKEIESYYGICLFDRIGKRLHKTDTAHVFYEYALHIVSLFESLETELQNKDRIGTFSIGCSITIANDLFSDILSEFKQLHPNIDIKVIIENSNQLEHLVYTNLLDFALTEGISHYDCFIEIPFFEDQLVLVCSKLHPFSKSNQVFISSLEHENLLLKESSSANNEMIQLFFKNHQMEFTPHWTSVSTQAIIKAVSKNLGVSILPKRLVNDYLQNYEIVTKPFSDYTFERHFKILHHKNKFITPMMLSFMELCKQTYQKKDV